MSRMDSVFFSSVTNKSPGVSLTLSALFTLKNFPGHKLSCQRLNCRAVLKELNYTEKMMADYCIVLGVCYWGK
jgi:hypothetical protein